MSRSDKTTKNRHVTRNHPSVIVSSSGMYNFIIEAIGSRAKRLMEQIATMNESSDSEASDEEVMSEQYAKSTEDSIISTEEQHAANFTVCSYHSKDSIIDEQLEETEAVAKNVDKSVFLQK